MVHPLEWPNLERLTKPSVSKNVDSHTLLVQVKIGKSTVENFLAVFYIKVKHMPIL